ncbi:MAG: FHA domain-containing protein [Planctomycetota bacterium]
MGATNGANGTDGFDRLQLTGTEGLLRNDTLVIRLGETVTVGRSRSCDFSMRRSKRFLTASEEEQRRILDERSFNKVSRQHARISFLARGQVEICDLSRNGTFLDDVRVLDRKLLQDLDGLGVEIRLADTERMRLRPMMTKSEATADA